MEVKCSKVADSSSSTILPLWIMTIDNNRYLYEYPLDCVPLAILAVVPAGRVWGQDHRLAARFGDRWPF